MSRYLIRSALISAFTLVGITSSASADDADQELAKKLSNPVSSLISVPLQFNYDNGYGPDNGDKITLNIQPVIPISLNADWNMISRTILPVTWQNDLFGPSGDQFGLGDITQSFFFSPSHPTSSGVIWGVGPALLIPTGTDDLTGSGKWGAGPTVVVLKQDGPWTVGMLANHIWSFAGSSGRRDVNSTFLQPFVAYATKDAWTFSANLESTYDWVSNDWSVPINLTVAKLVKVGQQRINLTGGIRYWASTPENGPTGLGVRFVVTFLFPK